MTSKIRTVVVDDEPVARARVLSLLGKEQDIEVVGEYADGTEAVSAIRDALARPALPRHPDGRR